MANNLILHSSYFNSQPHKEADSVRMRRGPPWRDFNSQPHKEADDAVNDIKGNLVGFQLTASQGG